MRRSSFCPACSTSIGRRERTALRARQRRTQAAAGLLVVGLQQRLLSSIEAFARSLKVHRATVARQWDRRQAASADATTSRDTAAELFTTVPDADDERGDCTAEEQAIEEAAAEAESPRDATAEAL